MALAWVAPSRIQSPPAAGGPTSARLTFAWVWRVRRSWAGLIANGRARRGDRAGALAASSGTAFTAPIIVTVEIGVTSGMPSTIDVGATSAPSVYERGQDVLAASAYAPFFELSANRTNFATSPCGIPGVTVTVPLFVLVRNQGAIARTVSISTDQVSNANVVTFTLAFDHDGNHKGTVDAKAASPHALLVDVPREVYGGRLTITLAPGAGSHNARAQAAYALVLH